MHNNAIIPIVQEALWLVLLLAAPPVFAAALTGLLVALLQAATQLQEQTTQYGLKFLAVVLSLFVTASLLSGSLYHFADEIMARLPDL